MALPKAVAAHVDPEELSVFADRGNSNLEKVGFLNVSGTSHTLHNPGGSDGQIQYNDGGGFGGSTTEFDDATDQTLFASGTASDPSISFKDSISIPQNANYVINLWRDRTVDKKEKDTQFKTNFYIPKARNPNGEGMIEVIFDPETGDYVPSTKWTHGTEFEIHDLVDKAAGVVMEEDFVGNNGKLL